MPDLLIAAQHDAQALAAACRHLAQQLATSLMADSSLQSVTQQPVLLAHAADVMLVMGVTASPKWLQVNINCNVLINQRCVCKMSAHQADTRTWSLTCAHDTHVGARGGDTWPTA
jgi:hypothetical protein